MTAARDGLDITVEAASPGRLARMEDVVAKHLDRFAFREGELKYGWTRAWEAGPIGWLAQAGLGADRQSRLIRVNAIH
jgi:hypothetical protein